MNKEEILAMEAGRELDGLITEKVFELRVDERKAGHWAVWNKEEKWEWLKNYSTDISAAFEIVEKMAKEGWMMYKLAHTLSGKSEVDGYICVFLNIQSGAGRDYTADTATLAICKAALLTLVEL